MIFSDAFRFACPGNDCGRSWMREGEVQSRCFDRNLVLIAESLDLLDFGQNLRGGRSAAPLRRRHDVQRPSSQDAQPGDVVAVFGIGGLGHLAVQFASKMGFRTVAIARGAEKAAPAKELGAHHYIDTEADDLPKELTAL